MMPETSTTQISDRLQELDTLAAEDGTIPNEPSRTDFLKFVAEFDPRRPMLSMLDNGGLRAVWKNKDGEHLALNFLGEGRATYVIWYMSGGSIKREYGRESIAEIVERIRDEEVDLIPILYRD
jgi:hypothetical protein